MPLWGATRKFLSELASALLAQGLFFMPARHKISFDVLHVGLKIA
jgi:hypothetical protein